MVVAERIKVSVDVYCPHCASHGFARLLQPFDDDDLGCISCGRRVPRRVVFPQQNRNNNPSHLERAIQLNKHKHIERATQFDEPIRGYRAKPNHEPISVERPLSPLAKQVKACLAGGERLAVDVVHEIRRNDPTAKRHLIRKAAYKELHVIEGGMLNRKACITWRLP